MRYNDFLQKNNSKTDQTVEAQNEEKQNNQKKEETEILKPLNMNIDLLKNVKNKIISLTQLAEMK